jgi:apolipoprotein N-acyltransferase
MELPADIPRRALVVASAVLLTATAYFVSSGLHRVWWLVWLAPLPILLLAPRLRAWPAFLAALVARALAGLDVWSYLHRVVQLPLGMAIASVLVPAAWFALSIAFYRWLLRRGNPWLAALAFPSAIVASEYLISLSQGTFLSTGYTQLADLPVLQLASVTGIWGISFAVTLFPAAAAALFSVPAKPRLRMAAALVVCYALLLSYGFIRLFNTPQTPYSVLVGLVETHAGQNMFPPDAKTTIALFQQYASQVEPLASQGAQYVIFPEMSGIVPDAALPKVDELFQKSARDARVQVLLGILHITSQGTFNEARLYSATGEIETVYRKHHPVPTWEARTTPGTEISVLACARSGKNSPALEPSTSTPTDSKIGIQICRDMDYPELARRYGKQQVGLVLVPAWDQGMDEDADWHGHLSLMRGVEDGFTIVRDAKNGLLTASDDRGRILAETPTRSDGALVTMLTRVPVRYDSTLYQKLGDWFAWLDLVGLAALVAYAIFGPRKTPVSN